MKLKKILLLIFWLFGSFSMVEVSAQCTVVASAYPTTVCSGDPVTLSSAGACGYLMYNDFNNGTAGTGWVATTGVDFSNPCNPTADGTIYMWMGSAVPLPRTLTTVAFDVNGACEISFDMKYATQSQSSPCEGIDEYNEGVSLQYSINAGATWVDIVYFQPDGVMLTTNPGTSGTCISSPYVTPFTTWANYTFPIPAAAQTSSTMFRWIQIDYSSLTNDHWGLDNIEILCPANVLVDWDHGPTVFDPPQVYPTHDTWYVVEITDTVSGLTAIDSVFVDVVSVPTSTFTVTSPVCSDNFSTITYTGTGSSTATFNWLFSGANVLSGSGAGPYNLQWPTGGTMWVSLEVTDSGCTSPATYDTVIVHQAPVASFAADVHEGCQPLPVQFTDLSDPAGSVWQWNFGDMTTSLVQNPSHTFNAAGLYDVSLIVTTAQGCDDTVTYTNYINVFNQPIANITATPEITSIVDPEITFSSTSTGVSDWFWNFGDNTTSIDVQSVIHSYNDDGVFSVSLIVTSADGCADTAYTSVQVIAEPTFYNVITPDGNGLNDVFFIENAERIPGNLQVFNRWGKKIWESTGESYMNDFDGENFSDGTYFYIYTYGVEMENEHQGTLTILR
ncbi:MAG: PKD domain-containing protein [Bacteroidales bacterium]|jgi:PKD repeat protein|nr:PKD domain-containing protein [Bacteroidales bacterium]